MPYTASSNQSSIFSLWSHTATASYWHKPNWEKTKKTWKDSREKGHVCQFHSNTNMSWRLRAWPLLSKGSGFNQTRIFRATTTQQKQCSQRCIPCWLMKWLSSQLRAISVALGWEMYLQLSERSIEQFWFFSWLMILRLKNKKLCFSYPNVVLTEISLVIPLLPSPRRAPPYGGLN